MTLAALEGQPNLAALPVLLLWLYPDKLSIAYSVYVTDRRALAVWTIVGPNWIEIARTRPRLLRAWRRCAQGKQPAPPRTFPESAAP